MKRKILILASFTSLAAALVSGEVIYSQQFDYAASQNGDDTRSPTPISPGKDGRLELE